MQYLMPVTNYDFFFNRLKFRFWTPTVVMLSTLGFSALSMANGFGGSIEIEGRYFFDEGQYAGQDDQQQWSVAIQPEYSWQAENTDYGQWQTHAELFYRQDSLDDERSHGDVRQAYVRWSQENWLILAGANRVFWGVAESRHLVDIVNQSDALEDLDNETKLGQAMVQLTYLSHWGEFSAFILPYFRERQFAGEHGRLRPGLPINDDQALYINGASQDSVDTALRYSHYLGDWDIGLSYFSGNSREPGFIVTNTDIGSVASPQLLPVYSDIQQWGTDLQYTTDAWLWKFEAAYVTGQSHTEGQEDNYLAAVGGFEYTLYQVFDRDADLGFLAEYVYDDRSELSPATAFNDDWFFAMRLGMNDSQDTALLAGVYYDADTGEQFYNVEGETRIGDSITAELRLRVLEGSDPNEFFQPLEKDSYIQLKLAYHF